MEIKEVFENYENKLGELKNYEDLLKNNPLYLQIQDTQKEITDLEKDIKKLVKENNQTYVGNTHQALLQERKTPTYSYLINEIKKFSWFPEVIQEAVNEDKLLKICEALEVPIETLREIKDIKIVKAVYIEEKE